MSPFIIKAQTQINYTIGRKTEHFTDITCELDKPIFKGDSIHFCNSKGWLVKETYTGIPMYWPSNTVNINCIRYDSINDEVWIANNGISRYINGTWISYNIRNGCLSDYAIYELEIGNNGDLWASTIDGVYFFDGFEWTKFTENDIGVELKGKIKTIELSPDGKSLWIGTSGNGLIKYSQNNWEIFTTENSGLPNDTVYDLAFNLSGNLWLATGTGGIVEYNGSSWKTYNNSNTNGVLTDFESIIEFAPDGSLWIASQKNGLVEYNGTNWILYNKQNSGLPNDYFHDLTISKNGKIGFIASSKPSLYSAIVDVTVFDGENWLIHDIVDKETGRNFSYESCLTFTNNELWVGAASYGGYYGIAKFDGTNWKVFNSHTINSISHNKVNSIGFDIDGEVLLALDGPSGIAKFDGTNWERTNSFKSSNYKLGQIIDFEFSPKNELWVASNTKISNRDDSWLTYSPSQIGLPVSSIKTLAFDNESKLWIGGLYKGIYTFDGQDWKVINNDNSELPDNNINIIKKGPDGSMWIGTDNGLANYNGVSWAIYKTFNSSLLSNIIYDITFDTKGEIWVATEKGLTHFNGVEWSTYTISNSDIPNDLIRSVTISPDNNVWVGTFESQIASFDGINWEVFDENNSSLQRLFWINDLQFNSNGDLFIGSNQGFVVFPNASEPKIILNTNNYNYNSFNLMLFPNPSVGEINVFCDSKIKELLVFDISGNKVDEVKSVNTFNYKYKNNNLQSGVYFLNCYNVTGELVIKKFIIE